MLKKYSFVVLVVIALLGSGYFWWQPSSQQANLHDVTLPWGCVAFLTGVVGVLVLKRPILFSSWAAALGFILAVMARVIYDTRIDPTSHNLFPFEIIIAFFISFTTSLLGGFAGWSLAKIVGREKGSLKKKRRLT